MDSITRNPSFGSLARARRRSKPRLFGRDTSQPSSRPDSELVDLTRGGLSPRSIFRLGTMNSAPRAGNARLNSEEDDDGYLSDGPFHGDPQPGLPGCDSVYSRSESRVRRNVLSDRDSNLSLEPDRRMPKLDIWKRTTAGNVGPADRRELAMEDGQPTIKEEPVERRIFEPVSSGPSLISKHLRNLDSMPTRPGAAPVIRLSRALSSSSNNIGRFNPKRLRDSRLPTPSIASLAGSPRSVTNEGGPADEKKQHSIKRAAVARMGKDVPAGNVLGSDSTGVFSEQQSSQRRCGGSVSSTLPPNPHLRNSNKTALAKGSSQYHIYNSLPPTFVPNGDTGVLDRAGLVLSTNDENCPWKTHQPTTPDIQSPSTGEPDAMDWAKRADRGDTFIASSLKHNQIPSTGINTAFQESDLHENNQSESAVSVHSQGDHPVQTPRNSIPTGEEMSDVQNIGTLPFGQARKSVSLSFELPRMISNTRGGDEPGGAQSHPQFVDDMAVTTHVNLDEVETASLSLPPPSPTDLRTSNDRVTQNSNKAETPLPSRWANLPPEEIRRRQKNNEASRRSRQRQKERDLEGFKQKNRVASKRHQLKKKGLHDDHQVETERVVDVHQAKDERLDDIRQQVATINEFITEMQSSGDMTEDPAHTEEGQLSGVDEPDIQDSIWHYYAQSAVEAPTEEHRYAVVHRSDKIGPHYSIGDISEAALRKTRLLFQDFYKDLYGDAPLTKTLKEEKSVVPPRRLPIFTMRYDELKVVTTVSRKIRYQKALPHDKVAYGDYIWLVKVRSEIFSTDVPGSTTTENEYACTAPEIANERAAQEYYTLSTEFIREWDEDIRDDRIDDIDDSVEEQLEDADDNGKLFDMQGVYDRTEGPMQTGSTNGSDDDDQSMGTDTHSSVAMLSGSTNLAPISSSAKPDNEHTVSPDVTMLDAGEANEQEENEVQSTDHAANDNHHDMSVGGGGVKEKGERVEEVEKGVEKEGKDVEEVEVEEEEKEEEREPYNPNLKLKLHVYVVQLELKGPKNK